MSDRLHNAPTPEGEYFDTGRFAGLSVLLGVIAFVACWWPAHRASQVDPVITLRAE